MRKLILLLPFILLIGCGGTVPEIIHSEQIDHSLNKFLATSNIYIVGHKLTTSNGEWKNSPTSFSYQWEDCNLEGEGCVSIVGATLNSYILTINDVGHTVRVSVKAVNISGSAVQKSANTPEIKNIESSVPSLTSKQCFVNPELCGYPYKSNIGVESGVKLLETTECPVLKGNEHYENKRLVGNDCGIVIAYNATGVVIKNDEIIMKNACPAPHYSLNYGCVGNAVEFERQSSSNNEGAKGTRFEHDFIHGLESHGVNTVQTCIDARWNSPYIADYVKTENCSGFKLNAGGELNHVYCPSNYEIGGEHYECVTDEGSETNDKKEKTPLIIKNSTILQPPQQHEVESSGLSAALFTQSIYGHTNEIILENDLFAGGGYTIESNTSGFSNNSKWTVRHDRFARCLSKCPDSNGYFTEVGEYKCQDIPSENIVLWKENFFDYGLEPAEYGVNECY